MESNNDENIKVSVAVPEDKEDNLDNSSNKTIYEALTKKHQHLQDELELCRNRLEQLEPLYNDKEKASKQRMLKCLTSYAKQAIDEKQQNAQKINSLESIVIMLKLKAKNSADYASRLEKEMDELKAENETLQSQCDFMMRILIDGDAEVDKVTSNTKIPSIFRNDDIKFDFNDQVDPSFSYGNNSSTELKNSSVNTIEHSSTHQRSIFSSLLSVNAPSSLVKPGIQSNTLNQIATFTLGPTLSASQCQKPAISADSSVAHTFGSSIFTNHAQTSLRPNSFVPQTNFATQPHFNFLNETLDRNHFKFSADTSNTSAVVVQRKLAKAKRRGLPLPIPQKDHSLHKKLPGQRKWAKES